MSHKLLVYTLRPEGTALWLPSTLARAIGLTKKGQKLTQEQYDDPRVQELLALRRSEEGAPKHGKTRRSQEI